ncbi:MAG: glycyl-radical enzyme activating protein [Erysipelotrichaceae bacterium]|nr:glycyl-radical enzyme activating protein [Erysipelotrichaceae bacterium]
MSGALISRIQRFSLHDGDGVRTTVFFKGCPLHCRWCHNPETITPDRILMTHFEKCIGCRACLEACPHKAIVFDENRHFVKRELCDSCGRCAEVCFPEAMTINGQYCDVGEIMKEIDKDKELYALSKGGVTLSGGEPMLHADFIRELGSAIIERGYTLFIDTAGYVPFREFEKINDLVDTYLYDIKSMNPDTHRFITGKDNALILENVRKLSDLGKDIIIRMPIMEDVNDSDENISAAIAFIKELKSVRQIDILPIHKLASAKYRSLDLDYSFVEDRKETDKTVIRKIIERFVENGMNAKEN